MGRKKILNTLQQQLFKPPRGRQEVWLPNWHITFVRSPSLNPNQALFIVPLRISKLDLKDYLFHAYGIPALSIRSSIQQHAPKMKLSNRAWYRPQSTKRMIVEMGMSHRGGPFAWPEEPKDLSAWDKEVFDQAEKRQDRATEDQGRYGTDQMRKKPGDLKKQTAELIQGKSRWKPTWAERGDYSMQQQGVGSPPEMRKRFLRANE